MKAQGIICGAGLGGLATAIAFNQRGIRADVYEQAATIHEVGAGLVLAPNALHVLKRLGLKEAIGSQSWPLRTALITTATGHVLQTIDVQALEKRYGFGMRVIQRGRLQKLLVGALPKDQLHTGWQLTDLHDDDQRVQVQFTNNMNKMTDFVIGADGIRSAVRRVSFGELPLRHAGQTCWRAIVDVAASHPETSVEYWGNAPGLRFGLVPIGPTQVYLYVTAQARAVKHNRVGQTIDQLRILSRGFATEVQRIVEAIDESRLHQTDLYDLPTLRTWSKGRVTLVGDSAHATTPNLGQGACQAIEDGFVLATCMVDATSVEQAFGQYQHRRKVKADQVVRISRQIGQMVNAPGWLKPLLFAGLQLIPASVSNRQFDAIYKQPVF